MAINFMKRKDIYINVETPIIETNLAVVIEENTLPSSFVIPDGSHFIRHFLNLKSLNSKYTPKSYERDILDFFQVEKVEDIDIDRIIDITIIQAEMFIMKLKALGYEKSSINRKVSSLSSLYEWLLGFQDNRTKFKILQFNPFAHLKNSKPKVETESNTEFLTEEEARKLLDSIDISTKVGLRNKSILLLAFTTALRKSEILNIKLKDITTIGGYDVIKVTRKGNKTDHVKLQPPVRHLILQYIERTGRNPIEHKDTYLFIGHSSNKLNGEKLNKNTLNLMIKKVCEKAGINKQLRVHSTRHTAITLAVQGGASTSEAKDFAGHKSIVTTDRYIRSLDKLKNNAGDRINLV